MILATITLTAIMAVLSTTPLSVGAFVVRSPTFTTGLVQQVRFGRVSPPFVLSDMIESSEDTPELVATEEVESPEDTPELAAEEETKEVESSEDSSEVVMEEDASSTEDSKRVVARERHTAFVGNLPFDATEADVKELFEQYGDVQLVSMPRNRATGQFRGFAFIDLASEEEVEAAVSGLDNSDLNGRVLRVSKSLPKDQVVKKQPVRAKLPELQEGYKKVYVGNLPFDCTRDDVNELLAEYGEVSEVFLPVNAGTGTGRGFAFVTMKEEEAVAAIEGKNGQEYCGRTLVVSEPLPPGKRAERVYAKNENRSKLYVGNLSFYTVRDTLKEIFEEFGPVHDCYMPEDTSTGGSRGFGFITMDTEAAEKAIEELDGCEVDGRIIRVNIAQPKGKSEDDEGTD